MSGRMKGRGWGTPERDADEGQLSNALCLAAMLMVADRAALSAAPGRLAFAGSPVVTVRPRAACRHTAENPEK
jgi:hypothetical protein